MTNMQETMDRSAGTPAATSASCCGQDIQRECLDGSCHHGRMPMWNTGTDRWEIPQAGPCGLYRTAGDEVLHLECPLPEAA